MLSPPAGEQQCYQARRRFLLYPLYLIILALENRRPAPLHQQFVIVIIIQLALVVSSPNINIILRYCIGIQFNDGFHLIIRMRVEMRWIMPLAYPLLTTTIMATPIPHQLAQVEAHNTVHGCNFNSLLRYLDLKQGKQSRKKHWGRKVVVVK